MQCQGASFSTARTTALPLTLTLACADVMQVGGAVYVYDNVDVLVDGAIFTECAAGQVRRSPPLSPRRTADHSMPPARSLRPAVPLPSVQHAGAMAVVNSRGVKLVGVTFTECNAGDARRAPPPTF